MGIHLGIEAPSAQIVTLALRHAILPKQYSSAYELNQQWGTYGLPKYLYTDSGKDFQSQHIEQVATELGIVCCRRRRPSDGGIVERPFGTFNSELFSTLPGYTGSNIKNRPKQAEKEACLTLMQLEKLLVRYIVDRYNQSIDARMGGQTRLGRWESGCIAQLPLLGERELDICLMRRARRTVYRSGYIQFANLIYQGEHLAGYAGESVVVRYNPRDITTVLIYQQQGAKDVFLTRAHAQGLETETLSLAEASAISARQRKAGQAVTNQSLLLEVRARDIALDSIQTQKKRQQKRSPIEKTPKAPPTEPLSAIVPETPPSSNPIVVESQTPAEIVKTQKPVPKVRVFDYEQLKQEYGVWRK